MKRVICVIAAALLLFSLVGCAQKEIPYEIKKIDGDWYVIVDEEQYPYSNEDACRLDYSLRFSTLEEMKSDLLLGNLTEKEMENFALFMRDEEGKAKICDLDNLWDCNLPEGMNKGEVVLKNASYYHYLYVDGSDVYAIFKQTSKEYFEEEVNRYLHFDEYRDVESKHSEEERDATVFVYTTKWPDARHKLIVYAIKDEGRTIYVTEIYDVLETDTILSGLALYGEDEGRYFYVPISNLTERPSVEWLSQFGLKDYVETEAA